jgi:thiamine kinase-like enzyme
MTDDIAAARAALATIPFFRSEDPAVLAISRLGGLTNRVFKVEAEGDAYVLRLPGKGTESYIDRKAEAVAAKAAAEAGVSPEVVHVDAATGILVTAFVSATTLTPETFRSVDGAPARAGQVFRRLHTSGKTFSTRFELFKMIDDYLKVLKTKKGRVPDGYHDVLKQAEAVREALNARPAKLVPCHCDPLCENFLDTGSRMWLVDWEYAGMNDPLWDLGDLSVEAGFSTAQETEMLTAYFGRAPAAAERGRVVIYKAMADLLWTLWGLIQHADKNPADDFWAYATHRFGRCKALMATPAFVGSLLAVRAG